MGEFPGLGENLLDRLAQAEVAGLMNPADDSLLINQDQCRRIDADAQEILVLGRAGAIKFHDLLFRIRQNRERSVEVIVDPAGFGDGINADRQNLDIESSKLLGVLRELAEFAHAVGSPIAAIKVDEHIAPSIAAQPDQPALRGRQGKRRRLLANIDTQGGDFVLRAGGDRPEYRRNGRQAQHNGETSSAGY